MGGVKISYKELQCATDVQNGLDPSRDDSDGSPTKFCEIRTDIQTWEIINLIRETILSFYLNTVKETFEVIKLLHVYIKSQDSKRPYSWDILPH